MPFKQTLIPLMVSVGIVLGGCALSSGGLTGGSSTPAEEIVAPTQGELRKIVWAALKNLKATEAIVAAQKSGLLGEGMDGYLAVLEEPLPQELEKLRLSLNEDREGIYRYLEEQYAVPLSDVQKQAARFWFSKIPLGGKIQTMSGSWMVK